MGSIFIDGLNEAQKEAVESTEGYIRVVAGPGSGKTRTLVNRFGYLMSSCGISTDNILCITFTNKAANVMKNRLKNIFGGNFSGYIHTFHSFCARILRDEIYHLNFPKSFNILDEKDNESIKKEIYEKLSINKKKLNYKYFSTELHLYKKNNIDSYVEYLSDASFSKTITAQDYLIEYLKCQRRNYYLDFDDLIFMCLYIFKKFPEVLEKYKEKFQYVLIDEFQDVTDDEFLLAQLISSKHQNLFVVGDPDQMIYSWRGAKDYIYSFDSIYPTCKTIFLDTNYRSTPEINNLTNSLIIHNTHRLDKKMKSNNTSYEKPIFYHAKDKDDEIRWICSEIKKLLSSGENIDDIAIIYRNNRNSRFVEEGLLKENIPYRVYGGIGFYERLEIKDLISYLRFIINFDDISFKRIINTPSRQFGNKKMSFLIKKQEENGKSLFSNLLLYKDDSILKGAKIQEFIELIDFLQSIYDEKVSYILSTIYQKSGYEEELITKADEDRLDNVNELLDSIKRFEDSYGEKLSLTQYIENITLISNFDKEEEKNDRIKMMTAHIAKGQEFKYVFVCALNENNFPTSRAITSKQMEEERRLAYVAFTRAKKQLYLSDAQGFDYATGEMSTSRFIFDIDSSYINMVGDRINDDNKTIFSNTYLLPQYDNFIIERATIGQRVKHIAFGAGKIISIDRLEKCLIIKFDLLNTTRSIKPNKNTLVLLDDYSNSKKSIENVNETSIINKNKYLSINEATNSFNITRKKLLKMLSSGHINILRKEGELYISKASLLSYLKKQNIKNKIKVIICILIILITAIILILKSDIL